MTTIAYRDGIMAADSGELYGDEIRGGAIKVFNTGKYLFALSGDFRVIRAYLDWILEVQGICASPTSFFKHKDMLDADPSIHINIILVNEDGKIWRMDGPYATPRRYEFDVMGSGSDIATGAMHAGATAVEAVQAACIYSSASMGPVRYTSFEHDVFDFDTPLTGPKEDAKQYTVVG